MKASASSYRTPSGRCPYKAMAADAHTKLRIREKELSDLRKKYERIPRLVRMAYDVWSELFGEKKRKKTWSEFEQEVQKYRSGSVPYLSDIKSNVRLTKSQIELSELRRQHEAIPRVIRVVCRMLRGKESSQDGAHSP